jgi:acyl-CoA thioesterase
VTTISTSLDEATQVEGATNADGRFTAPLSRAWEIWGPNGGYIAAIALRAVGRCAQISAPASIACQFLRSPRFAMVELDVTVLRRGRRSEAFAVRMSQDGKPVLQALVRTAAPTAGYEAQPAQVPDVPPPSASAEAESGFPFWANIERRPALPPGGPPATGVLREWARFRPQETFDDPFLDAARPLILLDTYGWPAAYRVHGDGPYIAPSLDVSVWFHRPGPPAWLLIDQEYVIGHGGLMGVAGRVWDGSGNLVASAASQLYCVANPDAA